MGALPLVPPGKRGKDRGRGKRRKKEVRKEGKRGGGRKTEGKEGVDRRRWERKMDEFLNTCRDLRQAPPFKF